MQFQHRLVAGYISRRRQTQNSLLFRIVFSIIGKKYLKSDIFSN
jgi:hypothetical protein